MALNVLIVDDSATMRAMVIKTLQMSGAPLGKVLQASDGQAGLDVLASEPVDVVLVDINMPVMNGMEMIERMRATPALAALPVIVVSTESSQTRIDQVQSKGVAFIHKPFTPERVWQVIQEVTGVGAHASQ